MRKSTPVSHRNQQVLFQHYLGIATRDQAEKYFAIYPSKGRQKTRKNECSVLGEVY
jgi:hypothetical protein